MTSTAKKHVKEQARLKAKAELAKTKTDTAGDILLAKTPAGLSVTQELITPQKAKIYLARSKGNRALSPVKINQYRKAIEDGTFVVSHQGIAFDQEGKLVDGHHRLSAIVETAKSVTVLVTRGLPHEVLATIDTGRPRGFGDHLKMYSSGVTETKTLAALLKSVLSIEAHVFGGAAIFAALTRTYANTELEVEFEEYKDILMWARNCHKGLRQPLRISASVEGAIIFAATCTSTDLTPFLTGLLSGKDLDEHSPALTLRNWLITLRTGKNGVKETHRNIFKVLTAVRAYILGKSWMKAGDADPEVLARFYQDQRRKAIELGAMKAAETTVPYRLRHPVETE